jgi:hypothetical protein
MPMPTLGLSAPFSDSSCTTTSMVLPLSSSLTGAAIRSTSSPSCSMIWSSPWGSPGANLSVICSVAWSRATGSRRKTVP